MTYINLPSNKKTVPNSTTIILNPNSDILSMNSENSSLDIYNNEESYQEEEFESSGPMKTSSSLQFLEEEKPMQDIFDTSYWSLYENNQPLKPLKFSNGKTQEDVVKEIHDLIKEGHKAIFLHGVCGTGKSAIALNLARVLGKASIIVPLKSLQKQYEEDYMGKMHLVTKTGRKMKIAVITGRDNHDSLIVPGISCADPSLPDTIKITDKNARKVFDYYDQNPYIKNRTASSIKQISRLSIAPANPYWSPILPADFDFKQIKDAKKIKYEAVNGDYIIYHRKPGCSYYDQFLSYANADVIIFNSAKYKLELSLGRKPATEVEIIDEADEFLDSLSNQVEINLDRLASSLRLIVSENDNADMAIREILKLIDAEKKNKEALGIDKDGVYKLTETNLGEILMIIDKSKELEAEILVDEMNYANRILEASKQFKDYMDDTYINFRKDDNNLVATLVTTNLSKKVEEILEKNKAMVFMSGTLHSKNVVEKIFGIKNYKLVEAESINHGNIEIQRTGKEFDCKYSTFKEGNKTREDYLLALQACVRNAKKPALIHVNAFEDLPNEYEISSIGVNALTPRNYLKQKQKDDKEDRRVSDFKAGLNKELFTTKCSRGVDFPGETCNSVIFTKYPNPNIKNTFWKILNKTHPNDFWEFYKDKARREFLQRVYRAVRSKDDHVYILSPDTRILEAARLLQEGRLI